MGIFKYAYTHDPDDIDEDDTYEDEEKGYDATCQCDECQKTMVLGEEIEELESRMSNWDIDYKFEFTNIIVCADCGERILEERYPSKEDMGL